MNNELEIRLIEGNFEVADANLLLSELLRFKIGFHDQKLFRDYSEFSKDNSNSKARIEALTRSMNEVRRLMARANDLGMSVEMECTIYVRTTPPRG